MNQDLLNRLREADPTAGLGDSGNGWEHALLDEWRQADVRFVSKAPALEERFAQAVRELIMCIKPTVDERPILNEGGVYYGCWLESTGTINAELLSRFLPSVSQSTYQSFAQYQRDDGCFPYKLTKDGPVWSQIQLVTPLARCVWNHYQINGQDKAFLKTMYEAMSAYDSWLATYRDTRGTGAVEAFCTFDTGHDLSSRFWHVPDSPKDNDPAQYDTNNPVLPFVAPDLTANVICQRFYLARIAEELGLDGSVWRQKAEASLSALFEQCFVEEDRFFYDLDRNGKHVKVQSDVLMRVLACEVGDDAFFAEALERYLLNTSKFFAKYPFTSVAMDDPRFDPAFDYNSWGGPSNFLSIIRAPHAFEVHERHVELSWMLQMILAAMAHMDRFPQTLNPYTGKAGFTEIYSPSILCLLDYVERLCGIQPRPEGGLWFAGLVPSQMDHRDFAHETAYGRTVDGARFELVSSRERMTAFRDGEELFSCPGGVRVMTDREGHVTGLTGMHIEPVSGVLKTAEGEFAFALKANEQAELRDGAFVSVRDPGLVTPSY